MRAGAEGDGREVGGRERERIDGLGGWKRQEAH